MNVPKNKFKKLNFVTGTLNCPIIKFKNEISKNNLLHKVKTAWVLFLISIFHQLVYFNYRSFCFILKKAILRFPSL